MGFIDKNRQAYGVGAICKVFPIAPSTYHVHQARRSHPELRSKREKRDAWMCDEIRRVWEKSFGGVYGARKIWRQLNQEGIEVARCTMERLMQNMGLQGARRDRAFKGTTPSDNAAICVDTYQ